MQTVTLIATAAMGLEAVVAKEVNALGYETHVENGKVIFEAPISAIPRCNLWLRSADRVKLQVGTFKASSFEELFEGTKSLPWEKYIAEDGQVPVIGKSVKSKLYSVPDCQAITKKAIVERLKLKYGIVSKLPESGAMFKVEIALLKDEATLTIDTSGTGLHKRGYRVGQGDAPLKETLAASLIMLTNWHADETLIDPFCGSGTIAIEAALIGQNIAPGFNREFASEEWSFIKRKHWEDAFQEAEDKANYDQKLEIIGSDIDHKMIDIAKQNAMESGLGDLITWKQMQVKDLTIRKHNGYLIGNPPYGQRLGDYKHAAKIANDLGSVMKHHESWSIYILTAYENFEKAFGQRATKKRKLFNGYIRTDYYQYFGKKVREDLE
ncbi:class I SAM-dependent RNA methyltransferase [Virgibacillus sp. AGTR]|uniref:Class I SAM-dependent RNA methyltransferase n=1 Tax=Virgibacillus salarius TaxID=447199 RepID=A0A941DWT9_9BACI|nr:MULTISPECIES: class I SAM-dependent RNA methyltransferase [Virgibacillus]NAZ09283.1 class I SAM-dependent RNA methyltransferase [Agaribacter marinus]MBR7796574.1 class I SAM-dependent RNA methyltransferase [Virgibacillus salarius]MCC2250899.1 class I SAM-dependent RNA methyltransferase [Virgibacillus sp. AGTR]MDY7042591.1 class I SAM-dependent RNA methyltransferase [Virgibacillus sp. M23]QRZ17060.1 class I SAM-dependent RNA methyltransferase [Virgibacillus sp. AGTR]